MVYKYYTILFFLIIIIMLQKTTVAVAYYQKAIPWYSDIHYGTEINKPWHL